MVVLPSKPLSTTYGPEADGSTLTSLGLNLQGKRAFSSGLIFGAGRSETKTGDRPRRADSDEQTKPLVPSQADRPPDIGETGQLSFASSHPERASPRRPKLRKGCYAECSAVLGAPTPAL